MMRARAPKGRAARIVWRGLWRVFARLVPAVAVCACAAPPRPADVAVIASGADLESLDPLRTVHPLSRQVQRYVYSVTLTRADSALRPSPYYARRWQWREDRRALTLALEPRLRWHDGTSVRSSDVAATLRAAKTDRASPWRAQLADVAGVDAPDDTTLVVRFAQAQAEWPRFLSELALRPRATATGTVGAGPFRFVRRDRGARWTFARNDAFPATMGGPPRLARLVVAVIDEPTTKFSGLITGELDVAGIAPTSAALLAHDPVARVLSYPVAFSTGLVFNTQRPPFDDMRVRHAVTAAIDRRRIVDVALAGYATPSASAVPPGFPHARTIADPRDVHRADSLLDAAGWVRGADGLRRRDGRAFTVDLATVGSGENAVEQLIQADLAARGITVAIRPRELGAFLTLARAPRKSFDLLLTGVPGDLALGHLVAMFATSAANGALDYAGYHRPALDRAFAQTAGASSPAARDSAWMTVQQVLDDSLPVAWLYHARGVQGIARRLGGVAMDLRGELATVHDWVGQSAAPR